MKDLNITLDRESIHIKTTINEVYTVRVLICERKHLFGPMKYNKFSSLSGKELNKNLINFTKVATERYQKFVNTKMFSHLIYDPHFNIEEQ